ncbi:GNAT family N-acetyltransferase [Streptomyces sp. B-S-A8]|uniref:GNAT family N-acetyltransferase n=1 Tax=Streptomyces solicavernae TaxID=3043614 RepID=A0ABT6RZ41_9ACTN|nr:GNAT family N-acetyltransferase [Streptomyces sp. B-S-A8]MDI3389677.1 GNAT family N-acetyltransferase [Streptomyces sp. B-S-A8]
MPSWTVRPEPYDSATAAALWRAYYTEVSDRWYVRETGRRTPPDELERGVTVETGADLAPPAGTLLVGRYGGLPGASAGLRLLGAGRAELTRVYVDDALRATGGGAALMAAVERSARGLGARELVLDTRLDLVEARALYTRHGFREIPAYATGPYSEIWYGKHL